jgi:hypothetical protein
VHICLVYAIARQWDMVDIWSYSRFLVHSIGCVYNPQTQPIQRSTGMAVTKFQEYKDRRKLKITEILLLILCSNSHQKTMKNTFWSHQITWVKQDFLHVIISTPFQPLLLTFQCNSHSETDIM